MKNSRAAKVSNPAPNMASKIVGVEVPASGNPESVAVLVGLGVKVAVGVDVGVCVGVIVIVPVIIAVGDGVGVRVDVGVGAVVEVGVAEGVATKAGPSWALTIKERVRVCKIPSVPSQLIVTL